MTTPVTIETKSDCILCCNGNDLPDGEWCRACERGCANPVIEVKNYESDLSRAVKLARGVKAPPKDKRGFA